MRRKFFRKMVSRLLGKPIHTSPKLKVVGDEVLIPETPPKRKKKVRGFNKHHRLPKSRGGSDKVRSRKGHSYDNIAYVPIFQHHCFNELFGSNPTAQEVCDTLNKTWIDPRYKLRFFLEETDKEE